ncbi:MAG TPA: GNAT family N-acetyltransferase [Nannocystaceae bacterium]|nr:GNAT family N-acetyltransferase [Nannocystaceae bacterium]
MGSSARIVRLATLGDPLGLQPIAEAIFGVGDRRPDWFARKLARECVDPALSVVALADDGEAPLGYVLVGTPPSRRPAARTAGTGVLEIARGLGLGRALVTAALAAVAADHGALEVWAEDGREPFWIALGFAVVRSFDTLLAFGRAPAGAMHLPAATTWEPATPYHEHQAFLAEAWKRVPAHERGTFELTTPQGAAIVHVARENRALAIHRTLVQAREPARVHAIALAAYAAVLERIPSDVPVVLIGADRVSSVTASLREQEWTVVQRGSLVSRSAGQAEGSPR